MEKKNNEAGGKQEERQSRVAWYKYKKRFTTISS
jgi:hypothetical protein